MDIPFPSERLANALNILEANVRNRAVAGLNVPEWQVKAKALILGHEAMENAGQITAMFDLDNPFDMAMLVWCTNAKLREQRKRECQQRN